MVGGGDRYYREREREQRKAKISNECIIKEININTIELIEFISNIYYKIWIYYIIQLHINIGIEKQLSTTSDSTTGALVHASKFQNMGKFYILFNLQEYIYVKIIQESCFITAKTCIS